MIIGMWMIKHGTVLLILFKSITPENVMMIELIFVKLPYNNHLKATAQRYLLYSYYHKF